MQGFSEEFWRRCNSLSSFYVSALSIYPMREILSNGFFDESRLFFAAAPRARRAAHKMLGKCRVAGITFLQEQIGPGKRSMRTGRFADYGIQTSDARREDLPLGNGARPRMHPRHRDRRDTVVLARPPLDGEARDDRALAQDADPRARFDRHQGILRAEPHLRPARRDTGPRAEDLSRRRGSPLLSSQRHRHPAALRDRMEGPHPLEPGAGREHDNAADIDRSLSQQEGADLPPQDQGSAPRIQDRAHLLEGRDTRDVSQPDLFRRRNVRDRSRVEEVLRKIGEGYRAQPDGAARGASEESRRIQSVHEPGTRRQARESRARRDGGIPRHHEGAAGFAARAFARSREEGLGQPGFRGLLRRVRPPDSRGEIRSAFDLSGRLHGLHDPRREAAARGGDEPRAMDHGARDGLRAQAHSRPLRGRRRPRGEDRLPITCRRLSWPSIRATGISSP